MTASFGFTLTVRENGPRWVSLLLPGSGQGVGLRSARSKPRLDYDDSYAGFSVLRSRSSILSIASMTFFDFLASLLPSNSLKTVGTICHDNPYLSLRQPHRDFCPPAESFSHNSSTSSCVLQSTPNEMASVNLKCGPPFNAMKSSPSSWNVAVMTVPLGPGPAPPYRVTLPTLEFLKIET